MDITEDKKIQLNKHTLLAALGIGLLLILLLISTVLISLQNTHSLTTRDPQAMLNSTNYYGKPLETFGLFGQSDFRSATRNSVTANGAYHGGGVVVDTSVTPNRVYKVDTGNSRILGFNGGDGTSRPADIVIGQPNMNTGTCNGDDNLGFKNAPTANSLCLMQYPQGNNTGEQWGASNVDVDATGNLYIADKYNNRVLKYNQPFSVDHTDGKGDGVADFVWGQDNFTSNGPNRGPFYGTVAPPDDHSLNLSVGYGNPTAVGVSVDPSDGGIWVADSYNGRVLHFSANSHIADVVLGQINFTTKTCNTDQSNLNAMCSPISARIDPTTRELYVIDNWPEGYRSRFLVYRPDANGVFHSAQPALRFFKPNVPQSQINESWFDANGYIFKSTGFSFNTDQTDYPNGLLWVNEHEKYRTLLLDRDGNVVAFLGAKDIYHTGRDAAYAGCDHSVYEGNRVSWPSGSIGQDSSNNLYFADEDTGRVVRYSLPYTTYTYNGTVCPPEGNGSLLQRGWNVASNDSLGEAKGLAIYGNQLIVQDEKNTRKVWTDYLNKPLGAPADIVLTGGMASSTGMSTGIDDNARLWTYGEHGEIRVYQLPFTGNNGPIADFVKLYWADTQTEIPSVGNVNRGIAFDKINHKLYFVDRGSRILRVSNYNELTTGRLYVDMVLGQTDKTNIACNQGLANPNAATLCGATQIKFDKLGDLYAVDDDYECHGNRRITVFMKNDLQNATGMFPNLQASKVFNEPNFTSTANCSYWVHDAPGTPVSIAFDSANHMVIGNDGYYDQAYDSQRELKQLWYYSDPINKQTPDASIDLYMGAPGEIEFDDQDNLLIQDHTWYRVQMINLCTDPEWLSFLPGIPPTSACSVPSPTPSPTPPVVTTIPTPTRTPTQSPPTPTPNPAYPIVTFISPLNGDRLPVKRSINVNVAANDPMGVRQIQIFIDGVSKKTCSTNKVLVQFSCSYNWRIDNIPSGNHILSATATNRANISRTTSITVIK